MKKIQEYIIENINNIFNNIIYINESRDNTEAKNNPGMIKDENGKILLEPGSYWWKSAKDMLNDLLIGAGKNLKKYIRNNDFIPEFKEIIQKCYSKVPENNIKFNTVPFVVKINSSIKHINPAQIYIRRNFPYKEYYIDELEKFNIYKEGSGFGRSVGDEFEEELTLAMQQVFIEKYINKLQDNDILNKYTEFKQSTQIAIKLYNNLESGKNLSKIQFGITFNKFINNINENNKEDIKLNINKYIFQAGGAFIQRNTIHEKNQDNITKKVSQIIDPVTLELNKNVIKQLDTELKKSGAIIADIIINTKPEENEEMNLTNIAKLKRNYIQNPNNDNLIFISVKCEEAQLSGINIMPPFYNEDLYDPKTRSFKDLEFTNNISFINLCKLFMFEPQTVFDYYKFPVNQRPLNFKDDKLYKPSNNEESENRNKLINILVRCIIGGNYIYVNNTGYIKYVPYRTNNKNSIFQVLFNSDSINGTLNPKSMYIQGEINSGENDYIPFKLVFRSSSVDKKYPFRLFVSFENNKSINKSTSDGNSKSEQLAAEHFMDKLFKNEQ